MDPADLTLTLPWLSAAWIAFGVGMVALPATLRWTQFRRIEQVNVALGGIVLLAVLWQMRATVGSGFAFHLLGVGGLALALGWRFAMLAGAVVVALVTALRGAPWATLPAVWLADVVAPAATMGAVLALVERFLPPNFFVYVFVAVFFGAGVSFLAAGLAGGSLLVLSGRASFELVSGEYAPYFIYLAFAEATLTGMLVTLAVVYRPAWITTFDDARYLASR